MLNCKDAKIVQKIVVDRLCSSKIGVMAITDHYL
jgi:predicted metal-dependent phosphoesterase TrpH